MSILSDAIQSLNSALRSELPDGTPQSDALAALAIIEANVRLVEIDGEKAQADALAKKDTSTLGPAERDAWVKLVRAKASDAEQAKREAAAAAAEVAAAQAVDTK